MTTHVFIVDWQTFKLHLEYLFAGTGSTSDTVDFNNRGESAIHQGTERKLVGMMADANRIRHGDQVIFYLQQNTGKGIYEGKFFGVFEACGEGSFLDDTGRYLCAELGKLLIFRTIIKPLDVYPQGITEWEALDEIKSISSPCQMLWSLIYRKLKGNRGNTMITIYEAERLHHLIRNKNNRRTLRCANALSFDSDNQRIVCLDERRRTYAGRQECINILPRMLAKNTRGNKFEVHLQAYITQHLGRSTNRSLDASVFGQGQVEWLGNEVSCGVGMQRIDIMLSVKRGNRQIAVPIELKCDEANADNLRQIQRYIDWVRQYYIPNRPSDILPVLLANRIADKTTSAYNELPAKFNRFNETNNVDCECLRYVEFAVSDNGIVFEQIQY